METLPTTESAARPMFVALDSTLAGLTTRYGELRGKPLTRMVVEDAKALDTDAKAFIAAAESSEAKRAVESAFKVHRFLSSMFKKATDPAQEIRRFCSGVLARWEQERRAEADRQRREREEAARKEQERQRLEEAAHLAAQGHTEEARTHLFGLVAGMSPQAALANLKAVIETVPDELKETLLSLLPSPKASAKKVEAVMATAATAAPLPPTAMPDAKEPAGKVEGVTVIETFKLDKIIDPKALAGYLVEHPEDLIALFEPRSNEWKRRATSSKGQWVVPGVTFIKQVETRNRG